MMAASLGGPSLTSAATAPKVSLETLKAEKEKTVDDFDDFVPPIKPSSVMNDRGTGTGFGDMSAIDALADLDLAAATEEWYAWRLHFGLGPTQCLA